MEPPLQGMRAFEAVARLGSVSRAASELAVTQPAITQQLRRLEATLGLPLVRRDGRRIALTPQGAAYAVGLMRGFAELRAATERCRQAGSEGVLTVALVPTLATRWLIPRLASFHAAHPDVEVRLATMPSVAERPPEDVDIAIRVGRGRWPGCRADYLMPDDSFPVASPELLTRQPLRKPEDLVAHTLLQVDSDPRRTDWTRWLVAAGAPRLKPHRRLGFGSSAQALEAARVGLGIAIGHRPFVVDDIAAGRLVAPFATTVSDAGAYYTVSRRTQAGLPKIKAFRAWLLDQASAGEAG
jgi:LysR family glycine cleavage system transcriptional activator